ncbi:mycothione reductase [Nigerium sp.]|uniref:mycothione reductase n=1 Tax=Nigerium sp. TaxID=2042655 RepID=UPI0032214133
MQHFDLCIIGSGSGNSLIDERLDDQTIALVDDGRWFGGTCLNAGCIPTKMLALPADVCRTPELGARVNVAVDPPRVDWPGLRDRVFGRTDGISQAGERWREQASNVTLFRETAEFVGEKTLRVGEETITADQFVIAAGSRPRVPDLPGMDDPALTGRLHTSDTIMRVEELPESLVILGGGFIAAEFAHVFSSFGTKVTVVNRSDRLLRREDALIAERYTDAAARHYTLRLNQHVVALEEGTHGRLRVVTEDADGVHYGFQGDLVLCAQGRVPNGARLRVDAAGVRMDAHGLVVVDEYQRTNVPGIWALGDVSNPYQLKHVANHEERVVQHNLLHPDDLVASDRRFVPPHGVFTDPQIASVGLTEDAARAAGHDVAVAVQEYASVAYGWALNDEGHCVKLVADRATKHLLGAHIIGPQATLLIQPVIQAMSTGVDVPTMARGQYWIHPALTEVIENALLSLGIEADA